jgi:hypothetical protein
MQRFFVTPILDRGKQYWMANFPAERKRWSRRAAGRKQKKFAKRDEAETFLEMAKREWVRNGGVKLALDIEAHYDFMRALEVLADVTGGTLEKAALVYRACVSWKEKRGTGYEAPAPLDRTATLNPRAYLACLNEANRCGTSVDEALESMVGQWLLNKVEREVRERARIEAVELKALEERNRVTRQTLVEWEKEKELLRKIGQDNVAYEQGRKSVIWEQRSRRNAWRKKRKEREKSNGNRDLQRQGAEEEGSGK